MRPLLRHVHNATSLPPPLSLSVELVDLTYHLIVGALHLEEDAESDDKAHNAANQAGLLQKRIFFFYFSMFLLLPIKNSAFFTVPIKAYNKFCFYRQKTVTSTFSLSAGN